MDSKITEQADALLANPALVPDEEAGKYLNAEHKIESAKDALDGAKQILMERFAENADLLSQLRDWLWSKAQVTSKLADGKEQDGLKFRDYFPDSFIHLSSLSSRRNQHQE